MAIATRERVLALRLLREQRTRSARARDLLRASGDVSALQPRERGFVTRLVLGVVRTSGTLDAAIDAHLRHGAHLEPRVRDALRLAAYELLFLGTPARVAVSQGVELSRRANRRTAGLANAVLRRVAEEEVPRMAQARRRAESGCAGVVDLALVGGLPRWLVGRLGEALPEGELARLVLSLDDPAPAYVAANLAKGDGARAERLMAESGLAYQAAGLPVSYLVNDGGGLARSGLVGSADLVPADLGAQAVALASAVAPGSRVLEVGQGRGTKSILLENAALSKGGRCEIRGVESEGFKVSLARRRMGPAALGGSVSSYELDARLLGTDDAPADLSGPFDLAFVDAPCSGTGTMRRHPEIPWSLEEGAVAEGGGLPRLQLQILSAAARCVRPGGRLAYSTCSVLREEDEGVVRSFLASEEGSRFEAVRLEDAPVGTITGQGFLRTLSLDPPADGHFLAMLRRVG